jgi:putative RNA 2'-phosphotransferase
MKDLSRKSKWLALVLRHKPEEAGIKLDRRGWAFVEELCDPAKGYITVDELKEIVRTDDKGRYEISNGREGKLVVRAVQGHSKKDVEIEMEEKAPPDLLYHGTKEDYVSPIRKGGLKPMSRQHVHLSPDLPTAQAVANRRKGTSVILEIDTKAMKADGVKFYLAKNGVWLTDFVHPKYIKL